MNCCRNTAPFGILSSSLSCAHRAIVIPSYCTSASRCPALARFYGQGSGIRAFQTQIGKNELAPNDSPLPPPDSLQDEPSRSGLSHYRTITSKANVNWSLLVPLSYDFAPAVYSNRASGRSVHQSVARCTHPRGGINVSLFFAALEKQNRHRLSSSTLVAQVYRCAHT
jgi:hypothetical protein